MRQVQSHCTGFAIRLFLRDNAANSAAGISDIAILSRDQVNIAMKDSFIRRMRLS
ncbi:hypothetical protein [Sulfitobacter sp. SK012]|uniref:hypothetical protein n=1 Tax=Sulfitobacter sp. SK012 TaxID=1389005 RepID=UPI0013B40E85|nr:hypothetical protein [Sulfitobacter sp. SK012]